MANDRLYLQCPKCNEQVYLCKHLEQGWYRTDDKSIGALFEAFIDAHFYCRKPGDGLTPTCLRLISEDDDEYQDMERWEPRA